MGLIVTYDTFESKRVVGRLSVREIDVPCDAKTLKDKVDVFLFLSFEHQKSSNKIIKAFI